MLKRLSLISLISLLLLPVCLVGQKRSMSIEPGIIFIPQKTWFFGTDMPETFNYAGGISLGLRLGDVHGLEITPMLSIQQGVRIFQPCDSLPQPCPPLTSKAWYFKLPVLYRATLFMNEAVIIKALVGPQMSFFVYPSDHRKYYQPVVIDAVAGFEICHYVTGNLYLNYGLRWDYSLTHPVKADVPDPFNHPVLPTGLNNHNMTLGFTLGADFMFERKFKSRSNIKPGARASGD